MNNIANQLILYIDQYENIDKELYKNYIKLLSVTIKTFFSTRKYLIKQGDELIEKEWMLEALYLLAMVDYLSRINDIPLCDDYETLRHYRFKRTIYPMSAWLHYSLNKDTSRFKRFRKESIPEFMRHNIVESEVRNVI